jgi:hypothetical protein
LLESVMVDALELHIEDPSDAAVEALDIETAETE